MSIGDPSPDWFRVRVEESGIVTNGFELGLGLGLGFGLGLGLDAVS